MFEDHCVKVAINLGGGRETSAAKIPLSVTEAISTFNDSKYKELLDNFYHYLKL